MLAIREFTIPNTNAKVRLNGDFSSEKLSKYIDLVLDGRITPQSTGDAPRRQLKDLGIEIGEDDYEKLRSTDIHALVGGAPPSVQNPGVLVVVAVVAITYAPR